LAVSAKLSQPLGQKLSNIRRQQKKISIGPILFLCYEESLVSSNLNSKQLRFHCVRPNVQPWLPFNKKIGDLFVLNSYIDKLYIKMLGFSKEID
jgi:hypothetical protein